MRRGIPESRLTELESKIESVCDCEYCGEPIGIGDEYIEMCKEKYHIECLNCLDVRVLLDKLGVDVMMASKEDVNGYR